MPISVEQLTEFLHCVDREVLRLGTREHVTAGRILADAQEQQLSLETLGDSLASALATDRDEWQVIRRCFDRSVTREPAPPAPRRWPRLAQRALLVLLCANGLVLALRTGMPVQKTDAGAEVTDLGTAATGPDLGPRDLLRPPRCTLQPLDATTADKKSHANEVRPPLVTLPRKNQAWLGAAVFLLSFLGLLLVRLWTHLHARIRAQFEALRAEKSEREARLADQAQQGQRELEALELEALNTGQAILPFYRIELHPPVAFEILEDCATLLGRAFAGERGTELDVDATLTMTVRAGGQVQPVFVPHKTVRPLLCLCEDTETRPYLPAFLNLLERWQRLGVHLRILRFERHPTTVREPSGRGRPQAIFDLLRKHEGASLLIYASRLTLRSRERDLEWPRALRQFPVRVWLDPDPRLPEERGYEEQAELDILGPQLPRFPLTAEGMLALCRHIAAPAEAVRVPAWSPPPPLADPAMARWVDVWLALGAQVPDASMEQLEAVRQKLLGDHLPDPRSIARLIERLRQMLGTAFQPSRLAVELVEAERFRLLAFLLKEEPVLFRRGFELLLESLGTPTPSEKPTLQYYAWRQRRLWYQGGLHLQQGAKLLSELDGTPMHAAAQGAKETLQALRSSEPPSGPEERLAEKARPTSLTWKEARIPALLAQSAAGAAVLCLILCGGVWLLPQWSWLATVLRAPWPIRVEVMVDRPEDERVVCQNRTNDPVPPPTEEVVKAPVPRPPPRGPAAVEVALRPRSATADAGLAPSLRDAGEAQTAGMPSDATVARLDGSGDITPPAPTRLEKGELRPRMVRIPAGMSTMGTEKSADGLRQSPFELSETEVTQAQYLAVVGKNPSYFGNRSDWQTLPVETVSWFDAIRYCNMLSVLEGLDACYLINGKEVAWWQNQNCRGYRLPTQTEWEYAARAGQKTRYAGSDSILEFAWYAGNSKNRTQPVKQKQGNAWHLYDLSGNVWEWVWDTWAETPTTPNRAHMDPLYRSMLHPTILYRALRGGSWKSDPERVEVASQGRDLPDSGYDDVGIRLARSSP